MYASGDFRFGLIPPIGNPAPAIPPLLSRQGAVGQIGEPASRGKTNPNGGLLEFPWTKTGGVDVPAVKTGSISPGGLPRNSSCTLAWVNQFAKIPAPPRTTQLPLPVT